MHLDDPVTQRIHDHLQDVGRAHEQAVAGARGVHVVPLVVLDQPVVVEVVDPPEPQRRPEVVALGGVVVDDVENDLDARFVQRAHHRLELQHLTAPLPLAGIAVVRGEEADRVVAPVVGQPALLKDVVGDELVHRHQFQRRHAQLGQMVEDLRVAERGVRAAQVPRDLRVADRQPAHVRLVDHGVVVRRRGRPVVAPAEERVDHDRARHVGGGVEVVPGVGLAEAVAVHRLVPVDAALDGHGVRVEQHLRRIAAQAARRLVGTVDAIAVPLPRPDPRQVAVPDEPVHFGQRHPRLDIGLVEQAQLHLVRDLGVEREVRARAVIGGPERIGVTRPDLDHRGSLAVFPHGLFPRSTRQPRARLITLFLPTLASSLLRPRSTGGEPPSAARCRRRLTHPACACFRLPSP